MFTSQPQGKVETVKTLYNDHVKKDILGRPEPTPPTPPGRTPLMSAAEAGHHDVVEALLDRGVDVNATDEENTTALMLASKNGMSLVLLVGLFYGGGVRNLVC